MWHHGLTQANPGWALTAFVILCTFFCRPSLHARALQCKTLKLNLAILIVKFHLSMWSPRLLYWHSCIWLRYFFLYYYCKNCHGELQEKFCMTRYTHSRDLQKSDFLILYMSSITDMKRLLKTKCTSDRHNYTILLCSLICKWSLNSRCYILTPCTTRRVSQQFSLN